MHAREIMIKKFTKSNLIHWKENVSHCEFTVNDFGGSIRDTL